MDWSWLLLLLCPLMMLPMMFMMMKGNHSDSGKHNHQKHLEEDLANLKLQNEMMKRELHEIKNKA